MKGRQILSSAQLDFVSSNMLMMVRLGSESLFLVSDIVHTCTCLWLDHVQPLMVRVWNGCPLTRDSIDCDLKIINW